MRDELNNGLCFLQGKGNNNNNYGIRNNNNCSDCIGSKALS